MVATAGVPVFVVELGWFGAWEFACVIPGECGEVGGWNRVGEDLYFIVGWWRRFLRMVFEVQVEFGGEDKGATLVEEREGEGKQVWPFSYSRSRLKRWMVRKVLKVDWRKADHRGFERHDGLMDHLLLYLVLGEDEKAGCL